MPEFKDYSEDHERRVRQMPIEWQILDYHRENLGKTLKEVFLKGGKIWGAITREKILLGDRHLMATMPYKEFAAYPIKEMPTEHKNDTKHQIYAAPIPEPTTISEVFGIPTSYEEDKRLEKIILGRVEKLIDSILEGNP